MSIRRNPNGRGFTLLEVLIALVILAVGTVAVIQVQSSLLSATRDSEQRSIAYAVAESKLEELRNFQNYTEFYSITSTSSGSWTPVSVDYGSSSSIEFTFDGSDVSAFDANGDSVAADSTDADYKEIKVKVNWGGESIVLNSIVGKVNPALNGFSDLSGSGGGETKPEVEYEAGEVPNVIPIQVSSDQVRETSKPLPDLASSNDSTEVRFETVSYENTASSSKVSRADFLTINCFCTLDESPENDTNESPYHYKYNSVTGELEVRQGLTGPVSKSGIVDTNYDQSSYCDRCCEGHHDISTDLTALGYPSFKQGTVSSPHEHYFFDGTTITASAASDGQSYLEACRFRRVNGVYKLFPDWNLRELILFPYTQGQSTAFVSEYQTYVKNSIQDIIFNTSSAAFTSDRSLTLEETKSGQVLARGIYLDDMSYDQDWVNRIASVAADSSLLAEQYWLEYVPFNEINMTLLAEWSPSDAKVSVTDDDVETVEEEIVADQYYKTTDSYSRGTVTGVSSGATGVIAATKIDNTGILANRFRTYTGGGPYTSHGGENNAIDSQAAGVATPLSASLPVTITAAATVTAKIIITNATYNRRIDGTRYYYTTSVDNLEVSADSGAIECSELSVVGGVATFECDLPYNASYTITVAYPSGTTYDEYPVIQNPKPTETTTASGNSITIQVGTGALSKDINFEMQMDPADIQAN
ncbi:MAG: prepilin-type N-terminal cleavage/methylation domain-containing protein [Gammaproteobacteria bacterium]|nr:prepilin-type N-terminal cleavage/methylation domain-containing protein [Gammaproteobacteria bacterium]